MVRIVLVILGLVLLCSALACTSATPVPATAEPTATSVLSTTPMATATLRSAALQNMEVAFVGNWSASEIQPVLDRAMLLYGVLPTEENYSRAASALIVLQKEYGPTEMEILDYMIRSHVPGVNLTFPEAAAFSVIFLAAGDR